MFVFKRCPLLGGSITKIVTFGTKVTLCSELILIVSPIRSSHPRRSVRKIYLRNFAKFTGKHLCLKRKFWHRCFPVNFAKFLKISFLWNTSWRLLVSDITPTLSKSIFTQFSSVFDNGHQPFWSNLIFLVLY